MCPWGHLQAKCDGFLSSDESSYIPSSIVHRVLNTWPVSLFMRHIDLPWTRNTEYFLPWPQWESGMFLSQILHAHQNPNWGNYDVQGKSWKVFPPLQVKICFWLKCPSGEYHIWLLLAPNIVRIIKLVFDAPDSLLRRMHTISSPVKFLIAVHVARLQKILSHIKIHIRNVI